MPKFRYAVLKNDEALVTTNTSGEETVDLPQRGILQHLTILWRHAHTYADNVMLPNMYALKKVEVLVNGSTVVKSISGTQIRALMWYNGGPYGQINDYDQPQTHNRHYHMFTLYFGRFANDTLYGLDLAQYAHTQLKITWDEATVLHDGVTYDVDSEPSVVYNVMAKIMDAAPAGFLNKYVQTREIDSWTIVAGTQRNTEIPRGFPLRGIMLRAGYKNNAFYDFWEKVDLDFDNGIWKPIDMDFENLVALQHEAWPKPVIIGKYVFNADGDDQNSEMYYVTGSGFAGSRANMGMAKVPIIYWPISTVEIRDHAGASQTAGGAMTYISMGWGPMQTFYIPMKMLLDGEVETIDTTEYGRIDFKTISGSGANASAKAAIVAEYDKTNAE